MADGDLQPHAGTVAETDDVHLFEPELPHELRDIVGGRLERDRLVAIRRPPVSLLLYRNHPVAGGKSRQHSAECRFDGRAAAR